MQPIHLFSLASQHNSWLATRQTLTAGNIANVNTPRYRAVDIEPFDAVLDATRIGMAVTEPGHMAPDQAKEAASTEVGGEDSWEVFHSGSNVSIEQELMKAGQIRREYSMNTNIITAFHRMLQSSARATGG